MLPPRAEAIRVAVGAEEDLVVGHGGAAVEDAGVVGDDVGGEDFELRLGGEDGGAGGAADEVEASGGEDGRGVPAVALRREGLFVDDVARVGLEAEGYAGGVVGEAEFSVEE